MLLNNFSKLVLVFACTLTIQSCLASNYMSSGNTGNNGIPNPPSKPGTCKPLPPNVMAGCAAIKNECVTDANCDGNKKCCKDFCGLTCQEPDNRIKNKPGSCAAPNSMDSCVGTFNECEIDGDCYGSKKCCKTFCNKKCQNPIDNVYHPSTEGNCPFIDMNDLKKVENDFDSYSRYGVQVIPRRNFLCEISCSSSMDCHKDETCCGTSCNGKICYNPTKKTISKPGECEALPPNVMAGCAPFKNECNSDMDCETNKKCCNDFCGRRCKEPKAKPGNCPVLYRKPYEFSLHCEEACTRDSQCLGNQKCCSEGCNRKCVDPTPVIKPGQCILPDPNVVCIKADEECVMDSQCPGDSKCCASSCGLTCQIPQSPGYKKPGTCTPVPLDIVVRCAKPENPCQEDLDCTGTKKCCIGLCGNVCSEPLEDQIPLPKPGSCPAFRDVISTCDVKCFGDHTCPKKQKCCSYGCGIRCVEPLPPVVVDPVTISNPSSIYP